ncbi:hypothetical protein ASE01_10070 [Nocardioides sp. Root190]|uniref:hypothetical protein n=1 Tax=Nocardioides sp. Root190 TaxID=1736488 RepID=UPI0006F6F319|nr:hypothetical protein [Nocardioides sp. Root190]KRB77089.1 hypothetical protein ASE01_10070 [Nocardioides sp. Root190]
MSKPLRDDKDPVTQAQDDYDTAIETVAGAVDPPVNSDSQRPAKRPSFADSVEETGAIRAKAEEPILQMLAEVGICVDSTDELDEREVRRSPAALAVLMDQFERGGQPYWLASLLGHLLSTKASRSYWERLKAIYLKPGSMGQRDGAAQALAACATREHYDELVGFLTLERRGDSRIHFLRKVATLGKDEGWDVIESYRLHPVLGKEATAMLRRRESRRSRTAAATSP